MDATEAVTAVAITFAPDLMALENLEENFVPEDLPAFSAAVSVVDVISFVIVCCAPFMVGIIVTDACATSITVVHLLCFPLFSRFALLVKEGAELFRRHRVPADLFPVVVRGPRVFFRFPCLLP